MLDIDAYNHLPSIAEANAKLHQQLSSAGTTLEQHLADLMSLFCEAAYGGKYTVWLCHAHFKLRDGERMVVEDDCIMKPTVDTSPNIVAEHWGPSGEELEYRRLGPLDTRPERPPADLLVRFNAINARKNISVLGISCVPGPEEMEQLKQGYIFMETTSPGERKHVTEAVRRDSIDLGSTLTSSWTLTATNFGVQRVCYCEICSHFCRGNGPPCGKEDELL